MLIKSKENRNREFELGKIDMIKQARRKNGTWLEVLFWSITHFWGLLNLITDVHDIRNIYGVITNSIIIRNFTIRVSYIRNTENTWT